ncbi:hypothetical protein A5780_00605 [Nocardia sp. 852002-20019_SCH5090214]|uniref:DUF4913 domain-containing protein n=1 Tax=Nocardia sp. 852002-20019_SCH5090214 TaxID=1834087 RepID=UPI0007E9F04F|nr:DUF4913 domain-containing protein [Nocardia sp. 852002-20019_SCH5090214]OBA63807.1 hypothetical protein A5780_00605 [Nocardia sp. 852002-20019_SCH5090214]
MTIPATPAGSRQTRKVAAPAYPDFVAFAEQWLFPFITVRLAEANREHTWTWCSQWWRHRAVSVRIAHLHRAFEAMRADMNAAGLSTFILHHLDPHFRVILDAANGPLHRCTRTKHVALPSLSCEPVPAGWFKSPAGPATKSGDTKPYRFGHYADFVEQWLLPVTAVRIAANHREDQNTWCRRWWDHRSVAVRFASLHVVFEAARVAEDRSAMSTLFVSHIDPHFRYVLDAANGPLHGCTPDQHTPETGLPAADVPTNWFATLDNGMSVDELGFGPDFRHRKEQ